MIAKVDAQAAALTAQLGGTPPAQEAPAAAQAEPPKVPETPAAEPPKDPAEQAATAAGLDYAAINAEFTEKGALSDATYEAIAKAGFPREVVDAHIAGQQALVNERLNEGYNVVGGQQNYSTMVQWAAANMGPAEIETFNKSVTGSPAEMKQAILGLKAAYEASLGSEPKLVSGQRTPQAGSETPFASRAEVTAAMKDARYANDPAYRAQVMRRIDLMDNF